MSKPVRYHPLLVSLHWLSALLILFMLLFGTFVLKQMPNNQAKILPLMVHMITGLLILVLTIVRFGVRLATPKPEPATAGNKFLDLVGVATHWLLYLGALGMGISGLGIAIQAGLFRSVFGGTGNLPLSFYLYAPRIGHGYIAIALYVVIALHVGAALYHQVIRKDHLLQRMAFARKAKG